MDPSGIAAISVAEGQTRRAVFGGPRLTRAGIIGLLIVGWLALIALVSLFDAWNVVAKGSLIAPDLNREGLKFNLSLLVIAVGASLLIGLARPSWWRLLMAALVLLPVPILLFTSGTTMAGLALAGLLFPTIWAGRQLALLLFGPVDRVAAWALGGAFSVAAVATLGLALGGLGILGAPAIWATLLALAVVLVLTGRQTLRGDGSALFTWARSPVSRRPVYFILAGIAVTFFWLNLIGALAPEIGSDAIFARLAAAQRFALSGGLPSGDPDLGVSRTLAAGEMAFAVTVATGPLQTAKLLHFAAGLLTCLALFAICRRFGLRENAGVPAFIFYTMPMVAWLSQTAYLDLFGSLFATAAVLAILLPSRPNWQSAVTAGVFIAVGVAIKATFGFIAVGLAVTTVLLLLRNGGLRSALKVVTLLTIVSVVALTPWLVRSLMVSGGNSPEVGIFLRLLFQPPASEVTPGGPDLLAFGYGRSVFDLLRLPYDLLLRSGKFGSHVSSGSLGYLAIALLPIFLLARPKWPIVPVLVGAMIAFIPWFFTAQYLRYGLSIVSILCLVAGVVYAYTMLRVDRRLFCVTAEVLLLCIGVAGAAVQLKEPAFARDFVLGKQSEAEYLGKYVRGYAILQVLGAQPDATRALTSTLFAKLYSPVRLSSAYLSANRYTTVSGEDQFLERLDEGGYSHILIDRNNTVRQWQNVVGFDDGFLRRNTEIVANIDNIYLFRVLPPGQRGTPQPWAKGPELLTNGGFESAHGDLPLAWTQFNTPAYDRSLADGRDGSAAVKVSSSDVFSAPVEGIDADSDYLLSLWVRGAAPGARAQMQINWLDGEGNLLTIAVESVPADAGGYRQFSMLAKSPPGAVTAMVNAQAEVGEVWIDNLSLRTVRPAKQVPNIGNLLLDPDFSGLSAGSTDVWKAFRMPAGRNAGATRQPDNTIAAFAWPESGFWQAVPIQGDHSYRLSFKAWSDDPDAEARVQINWLGPSQEPLTATIDVVPVGDRPIEIARWMKAPAGAGFAQVYVSVQSGGPVSFSDYVLQSEAAPSPDGAR